MTTAAEPSTNGKPRTGSERIPQELRDRKQWVLWRYENRGNSDKPSKVPYQPNGRRASSTDSKEWSTFGDVTTAWAADYERYNGVGFVFSPDDPYVGIDLDNCRNKETGVIEPWAQEIIDDVASYAEVSPRQKGVKIWAKGDLPSGSKTGRKRAYKTGAVEMYDKGRFFCVTAKAETPPEVNDSNEQIKNLWQRVFDKQYETPNVELNTTGADAYRKRCLAKLDKLPESIEGDNGSDAMYHAACEVLRCGFDGSEARELLEHYNQTRCSPSWSDEEIDHKLADATREILRSREFGKYASKTTSGKPFDLKLIGAAEFAAKKFDRRYLIDGVVVDRQHLVIGGPKKSLKTSIMMDLAIATSHGCDFLGEFQAFNSVPTIVVSIESGEETLQELMNRIAAVRGVTLDSQKLKLSFERPQLAIDAHLAEIENRIIETGAGLFCLDPAYLSALERGKSDTASNVFGMGMILDGYGKIGQRTGCTMCLVHHARKTNKRQNGGKPELDDLSFAGFAEWPRQWLLLQPREAMRRGRHSLWMVVGGSAGHHGEWQLDIDEGDVKDPLLGRQWIVNVYDAEEVEAREAADKQAEENRQNGIDDSAVLAAIKSKKPPVTRNAIRKTTGFREDKIDKVARRLVADRKITITTELVRGKGCDVYRAISPHAGGFGSVGPNFDGDSDPTVVPHPVEPETS